MPRQMYGLGSLVKSITKGVKKIVKSPIGKAAALYFAPALIPGGASTLGGVFKNMGGFSGLPELIKGGVDKLGLTPGKDGPSFGQMSKVFGIGSLGGAALEALTASGADEEGLSNIRDLETLKSYLRRGYKQLNPSAETEQIEEFVTANTREYAANGGRIGYADGTEFEEYLKGREKFEKQRNYEQLYKEYLEDKRRQKVAEQKTMAANGGRIGFKDGPSESDIFGIGGETLMRDQGKKIKKGLKIIGDLILDDEGNMYTPLQYLRKFGEDVFFGGQKNPELPEEFYNKLNDEYIEEMKKVKERGYAGGGRIGYAFGNDPEQNAVEASGIMNLPLNQNPAGATELDLRETGGFIPPVGVKEKEDDIPAMLSNNEFVFTADAVRGMGDGDVNKGAQRMYDMMKKLEGGGRV